MTMGILLDLDIITLLKACRVNDTGKEAIATTIHRLSPRSKQPLVKISCATLHADLVESELFGHEKGAFTNAYETKIGKFGKSKRRNGFFI